MLRIMLVDSDKNRLKEICNWIPESMVDYECTVQPEVDEKIAKLNAVHDYGNISHPYINNKIKIVGTADTLSVAIRIYEKEHPHLAIVS